MSVGKSLVAIVGRPNVGKSRLFNRLTETQQAIVHDEDGVTRDRQYGDGEWYGKHYTLIDTGGFVPESQDVLYSQMRAQAQLAMEEADVILFVMDCRAGLVRSDVEIHQMLRETEKPVFFVVNKVDQFTKKEEWLAEFYELGEELYPISAEHGHGLDNLMDDVAVHLTPDAELDTEAPFIRMAVVGKPNAGKSSLVNAFIGQDRLLTSDLPGTTRDAIDTTLVVDDQKYLIIDTAGLRRKRSITLELEEFSVVQAIRSIDRCDVGLLIIDAVEGVTGQDKKIASVLANRGRACVVVVNKWDLVEKDTNTAGNWVKDLRFEMPFIDHAPVIFVSALTGQRVHKILTEVHKVFESYTTRIPTSQVNQFLEEVVVRHSPPVHRNRRLKFYFATQVSTRPPTFMFVVNFPDGVAPSYRRFLENQIRERWGFEGTPIRTVIRPRKQKDEETR